MTLIEWYIIGLAGATVVLGLQGLLEEPKDCFIVSFIAVLGPVIAAIAVLMVWYKFKAWLRSGDSR